MHWYLDTLHILPLAHVQNTIQQQAINRSALETSITHGCIRPTSSLALATSRPSHAPTISSGRATRLATCRGGIGHPAHADSLCHHVKNMDVHGRVPILHRWRSDSAGGDCHCFQPHGGAELVIYVGSIDTVHPWGRRVDQGHLGQVVSASWRGQGGARVGGGKRVWESYGVVLGTEETWCGTIDRSSCDSVVSMICRYFFLVQLIINFIIRCLCMCRSGSKWQLLASRWVWIHKRRTSARVIRKLSECDSFYALRPSPPCLCVGSSRVYLCLPPHLSDFECQHAPNAIIAANFWSGPEVFATIQTTRDQCRNRRGAQPVRMKRANIRAQLGLGL